MPTRYYTINHVSRFTYAAPIRESVMEVRMRPRDEAGQQVVSFDLAVSPRANLYGYRDAMGNHVHHFDIPSAHVTETITAETIVRRDEPDHLPESQEAIAWDRLENEAKDPDVYEMTLPSRFAEPTEALDAFAKDTGAGRQGCPMSTMRHLMQVVHDHMEYRQEHTHADSPIDVALEARAGVCQDYAHILTALGRKLGIPCRYVSGYLARRDGDPEPADPIEASHAWVEAWLPDLGWVGFDPTHATAVHDRHVRTAIGRDYSDVPPTRGVYRGSAPGTLEVAVQVRMLDAPPTRARRFEPTGWGPPEPVQVLPDDLKPFETYAQQIRQQQHVAPSHPRFR